MRLIDALPEVDPRLFATTEGRKAITAMDPLMFAAVYLPHKLKTPGSSETYLNQFHLDICNYALSWAKPLGKRAEHRDCFIAPRMVGKSTWIFHILPLWAAAHEHKSYIIAFSDTEDQARGWLMNFKTELASNDLLQQDFPELCEAYKRGNVGKAIMDNRNAIRQANGFIFQAKGADSSVLGANVDGLRPQVLLFDDIEPPESNYGPTDLKKRKNQILSSHFFLNENAIVAFVGTTTMPNSLIDQMRKVGDQREYYEKDGGDPNLFASYLDPELRWVAEQNIQSHYYPAVIMDEEGNEHSLWPEVWRLEDWDGFRSTREFQMNMMNRPVSGEDGSWDDADIVLDALSEQDYRQTILSIDPAVTTARRSDYTAFAVLSRGKDNKTYVRHVEQVKLDSDGLRSKAEELVKAYGVGLVLVETNQGGNLWKQVFKGIEARLRFLNQRVKKELRINQAADFYKKKRVLHTRHFAALEEQMLAYPNVQHDDLVDAVATGILFLNNKGAKISVRQIRYQEV